ncbi:hypothetical protein Y1Q_0005863 [Alligator mississippiensis]|uniref:Uncharacterized protein n=1 Tax=Alligator mississippiensis TaxID=8496 RepID=A0A151NJS5_ALLMI|nr:hypothetical protein Y1Q_0005863 [Alligator mississippiensis]
MPRSLGAAFCKGHQCTKSTWPRHVRCPSLKLLPELPAPCCPPELQPGRATTPSYLGRHLATAARPRHCLRFLLDQENICISPSSASPASANQPF